MGLSWLGGADFVDGTGQLFRRLADGSFVGAGGDHLAAFVHAGMSLAAGTGSRIEGALDCIDWKCFVGGVELERGAKLAVKKKSKEDGDILLVKSDGTLVDGAGAVYTVTPGRGILTGPGGVVFGATGVFMTPDGNSQSGDVTFADGAVKANGSDAAAGTKIVVKKQIGADEGNVLIVGPDGTLQGPDGTKYKMRADGKIVSDGNKVFKPTGKVVTAEQSVLSDVTVSVDDKGERLSAGGSPLAVGAKVVIHQKEEEEEELEPPPKPVTIKGDVTLKDMKGDVFAEVHKDDTEGTVIGAESVIIIKNAKGKEVVRITRGYVTVKNFNVEEIVQIMRGVVSVKTMAGKEMVHVEKGEIYIEDFDGEVIVNNLADVNKLDEEMSLKNL